MQAYVELAYRRAEDRVPVVLLAPLPTVRAIQIGGVPTDLRLPGVAPEAIFATVSLTYDHFHIEPRSEEPVLVNGAPVGDAGVELHDGDVISIRDYQLTFHEGDLPADVPVADTPLRWKLRSSGDAEREAIDEPSRPYIEEFQLSIRPLIQADRHAEIQRMAEAELTRLARADEPETLETYSGFLWWLRVRSAREASDPKALEIANLAMDMHASFAPLMVACAITFLRARDWKQATTLLERVFAENRRELLLSVHDARLGRVLAEHFSRHHASAPARAADDWRPTDWNVPEIPLHAPGDEWLLWRIARFAFLFGDPAHVRFVFRGNCPQRSTLHEDVQRWDIADTRRGVMSRRLLRVPAVSIADPSLVLEVNAIRSTLESEDRGLSQAILDLSHRSEDPDQPPVLFHQSALDALPPASANGPACLRIWSEPAPESQRRVHLELVQQPSPSDIVYRQGPVCVAVAEPDSQRLAGSKLCFEDGKRPLFYIEMPGGGRVVAHAPGELIQRKRRWPGLPRGRVLAVILVVVGVYLLGFLLKLTGALTL